MSRFSSGPEWEKLRAQVLTRDNYTCVWCSIHLEPGWDPTVDHVVAKANGGEDSLVNCVASCRSCNGSKGANELVRLPGWNPKCLDHL
jgi:5-methylcytosine-specific restriction protein A